MIPIEELLPPGTRVQERYTLQRKIGVGGFASVFAAVDEQIEREVAVKFLHSVPVHDEEARAAFLARFEREAKLAARIRHTGVVSVFDYGITTKHRIPFIAMELLDGDDLADIIKREQRMAPERLIPLFIPALEALGYAHEVGIVHRDLKPANLFLRFPGSRRESLCVVDFGIAYMQDMNTRLTQTGNVIGTPAYVAPEYVVNQTIGPALDVYQMGLILVECLSGKPVVSAPDSMIAMFQHVYGNLSVAQELLDSSLGPILQKALAWNPDERYPDGFAFADALKELDPATVPVLQETAALLPIQSHPSREMVGVSPVTPASSGPSLGAIQRLGAAPADSAERVPVVAGAQGLAGAPGAAPSTANMAAGASAPLTAPDATTEPVADASPSGVEDDPRMTSPRRSGAAIGIGAGIFLLGAGLLAAPGIQRALSDAPAPPASVTPAQTLASATGTNNATAKGGAPAGTAGAAKGAPKTPGAAGAASAPAGGTTGEATGETTGETTGVVGASNGGTNSALALAAVKRPPRPKPTPAAPGRTDAEVMAVIEQHRLSFDSCASHSVTEKTGKIVDVLTINPSGEVIRVQPRHSKLSAPRRSCVTRKYSTLRFPRRARTSKHTITFTLHPPRQGLPPQLMQTKPKAHKSGAFFAPSDAYKRKIKVRIKRALRTIGSKCYLTQYERSLRFTLRPGKGLSGEEYSVRRFRRRAEFLMTLRTRTDGRGLFVWFRLEHKPRNKGEAAFEKCVADGMKRDAKRWYLTPEHVPMKMTGEYMYYFQKPKGYRPPVMGGSLQQKKGAYNTKPL